jgi:hypothetical protein
MPVAGLEGFSVDEWEKEQHVGDDYESMVLQIIDKGNHISEDPATDNIGIPVFSAWYPPGGCPVLKIINN